MSDTNKGKDFGDRDDSESKIISDIEFISRSSNRWKILSSLSKLEQSPSELEAKLGIPRTTLQRNLYELEEKGWINELPTQNVFQILPPGEFIVDNFSDTIEAFQTANSLSGFFNHIPQTGILPDIKELEESNIIFADNDDPYAPMFKFIRSIKKSPPSALRAFSPAFNPMYIDPVFSAVENGMRLEFIGNDEFYDSFKSNAKMKLDKSEECSKTQLFLSNELPGFGVYILDKTVLISAYDQTMRTYAILESNQNENILQWAEQIIERHRKDAILYDE